MRQQQDQKQVPATNTDEENDDVDEEEEAEETLRAKGPHDACIKASYMESRRKKGQMPPPLGWKDHHKETHAIPFMLAGGGCGDHKNVECEVCKDRCGCCEKPTDSELASDIFVVYAKWDNYRKVFVPVCMEDCYDFMDPPYYYQYAGLDTSDALAAWCFVVVAVLLIVSVAAADAMTSSSGHGGDGYHYYYSQPYYQLSSSSSMRSSAAAISAAILLPFLVVFMAWMICWACGDICCSQSRSGGGKKKRQQRIVAMRKRHEEIACRSRRL